jgi:malonyl-CoA/methylmalonyl-CoA synthetase
VNHNLYAVLSAGFPEDLRRPCLLLPDGSQVSYGQIEQSVAQVAGYLQTLGVEPGARVALQADKSVHGLVVYLGVLKAGAVFLPLNPAYTPAELEYFLDDAQPSVFITDPQRFLTEADSVQPMLQAVHRAVDDLAALIYTSGTTGRSKGAMLSHGGLAANAHALQQLWGFSADDVLLHALPIFHVHGLFISLHCALLTGSAMFWLNRFAEAEVIAALPRCTLMMGVPTFYTRLLAHPAFTRDVASGLRVFISGSAPLLDSTFREFEVRTGQRILERYGMSESVVISSNPLQGERIAGSVGYPLSGVELRIADGAEVGVIEIRGPSVFKGYWRNPTKTAEDFTADGYFRTGDVGRCDADGRVWISGRAKDLIISGGFNVYPREVEMVLDELPGVTESAVIGVPHPDFGEGVVAIVEGQGDAAALIAECRRQLAAFKTPKRVVFVTALPRNTLGKVQKNHLRHSYRALFSDPSPT